MTVLRHPARIIASLLTALLFAVPSARAGEGSFSIQMFPFSVPVIAENGRTVSVLQSSVIQREHLIVPQATDADL